MSKNKESEGTQGKFDLSAGQYYGNEKEDKGLHTTTDARFYQTTAAIPTPFSNKGKTLILQYSIKHEQRIDCGGGYIKLHPAAGMDQENYNGDTPYNIMFGPDICGSSTKKTHLIFNYKGTNHLVKKEIKCESDEFTHLYTLVVKPDNTYSVSIDEKEVQSGSIKEDFDVLPPKQVKDPKAHKPEDWVDEKFISDPTDSKPEGWDNVAKEIVDPDAKKPEDWDDELDGEWEAPTIHNPEYKGEWRAKQIDNPAYKGEWIHPMIDNPDWFDDDNVYADDSHAFVGIEIWQVKAGTIFDHILVTDSADEATAMAAKTRKTQEGEKKAFDKAEEERKEKEEAERKAREDNKEDDHAGHDHDHSKEEL